VKNFQLRNNPELQSIYPEYPGNTFNKGRFHSDEPRIMPGWKTFWRWLFSINPQRKEKKNDAFKVEMIQSTDFLNDSSDKIVWLGHACFYFRINNVNILTDPCLFDLPFKKRKVGLPVDVNELKNIDFILLSHGHRDHLDMKSLSKLIHLNPDVKILTALEIGKILPKKWRDKVQEAGWYQVYNGTGDITITFLPAQHWNRRYLTDTDKQLWGSFLIEHNAKKIYFAADTAMGKHFDIIRQLKGNIDYCILPVGAYKPEYMMKGLHLNPNEAIMAYKYLGGKYFIPMHYGTYSLSDEPPGEPIRLLEKASQGGKFSGKFMPMVVGEAFRI
jgi:L-ascorbate metabolism protein UlaG (beta-lactamase superfamily)